MPIAKCEYNWDYMTIDIYNSNGLKINLLCEAVEAELEGSPAAFGRLDALKMGNPLEYARMFFEGSIQEYCDRIDRCNREQASIIFHQYKTRYPDMSDMQINSLIREFQMYND